MSTFTKPATGQSALKRCRAIDPGRDNGGPFMLAVRAAGDTRLLVVTDATGQAIETADLLGREGIRAAATRLIRQHQRHAAMAARPAPG